MLPQWLGWFLLAVPFTALLHSGLRQELWQGAVILAEGDLQALQLWAQQFGLWAPLATSALMIAQALAAPIPAVLVTWTNSLLFGWFWGGCLSIFSATVAASVCYGIGRLVGMPVVHRAVSPASLERWQQLTDRYGSSTVLVSRLLPFVPFDPISYIAGLVRMRFLPFFLMTLAGQIPAGFAYSYLGSQITRPARFLVFGVCLFTGLLVIGFVAKRLLRQSNHGAQEATQVSNCNSSESK